ncbi:MAG: hypothetical protein BWY78_00269 [Alphaproteobacteria bacterium ADurb.Bin438]|nr:MAG: hypothetical protein BWY78_00269 [Alphaproteobacteria bacterium ADurb.Bin438]
MNISDYAKIKFEKEIDDNEIADEIKKAFFSYCSMNAPEEFQEYHEKLGYCYIFTRTLAEFLYQNDFNSPVFSLEASDLDEGIDEQIIDIMCQDMDDFCTSWTNDDIAESNMKAIPLLKKAFPNAPLITNILGIAVGLPDDDPDIETPKKEDNMDAYEKRLIDEIEESNRKIRENRIKQAIVMQAYIKEVKKKKFPIDEKMLILNYFKEATRNPKIAWENFITSPAFFSPIQIEKLIAKGIKEKDIPEAAKKANKEIGDFLKTMKF